MCLRRSQKVRIAESATQHRANAELIASIQRLDESIHQVQESNQPTIEAIVEEKRQREAQRIAEENKKDVAAKAALAGEEEAAQEEGEMGGLEEEADQQGAFNPETGEINWDCPCLGGMAHGPCGEEFKAAFSCFVYSNEEPKGVECIDKFK
jgi:intermembrane space import and assembly protein 40